MFSCLFQYVEAIGGALRGPDFGLFDSAIYRPIRPFWTYLQDPHVYDETQSFLSNVGVLL